MPGRIASISIALMVPTRVGSIVHVLPSFGVGGQERVALDLAIGQSALGHVVSVVSLDGECQGPLADEFEAAGIRIERVSRRSGIDPFLTGRLVRVLHKLSADVVHTHNPLPLIYGAPAARMVRAVAIHTKHGRNPSSRGNRFLRRTSAKLLHAFVAVSEVTASQARQQNDCSPKILHVIPNGIRLGRFSPDAKARAALRNSVGIPDDAWVVGTVGRIDDGKNHAMLIRALAPTLSRRRQLVIVGDGPLRADIEALVATLAEPQFVHVLGRRMDIDKVMPAFDAFALPSKSEGLPLVLPEAMACGLPVVATEVGGVPSVVDEGETGLLVPVDERSLADALAQLAADPARARAMGSHGRTAALARFSSDRMVRQYLTLYARCGARDVLAPPA